MPHEGSRWPVEEKTGTRGMSVSFSWEEVEEEVEDEECRLQKA